MTGQSRSQHVLDLKIPPVVLGFFTAALMWIVSSVAPSFAFVIPVRNLCIAVLVSTGVIISVLGVVSFRRAGTTVNPLKPEASSVLVDSGIYRFTRNPMYLGFLLMLLGWAVILSNILVFLLLPVFILYMNRFQIEPEERVLAVMFGRLFDEYKSRVRRWV